MFLSIYSCKHSAYPEMDKEDFYKGDIVHKSLGLLGKVSVVLTKQDNIDAESILKIIIHKQSCRFLKLFH